MIASSNTDVTFIILVCFVLGYYLTSFVIKKIKDYVFPSLNQKKDKFDCSSDSGEHHCEAGCVNDSSSNNQANTNNPPRNDESEIKDKRFYELVLGLSGSETPIEIKRKYLEKVVQYHPDKVNHLGPKLKDLAEKEMKAINEAYSYLREFYNF